jgi:hypothetical protein
MGMRRTAPLRFLLGASLVLGIAAAWTPVVSASGGTYYVDGKTGSDSNSGTSTSSPFKTIYHAAAKIPAGTAAAGWTVNVKGYTDFIYRERPIPPGWSGHGSSSAPVVFRAYGYNGTSSGYVKPIIDGADVASRWQTSGTAGVWKTQWPVKPWNFKTYTGSIKTALFQDKTTWLWEQTSLSALATRAKSGLGGYWWSSGWLYASGKGTTDPSKHTIDVVMRNSFLFMGTNGASGVQVRGFEVRHSANGIALIKGVDNSLVADNLLIGNDLMGIQTSGGQTSNGPDPASNNTIARNRAAYNTVQGIKVDEGSTSTSIFDNEMDHNALQGIKVQGPPGGTSYTGKTSGITLTRNSLHDQTYNPTGSAYNNASGLTISNGASTVVADSNTIYGNDVGIHVTQESSGRSTMTGIALKKNVVHDNRRFGIYFYDGAYGTGNGSMRSDYDVVYDNGIGIQVARGSTNKTISHATIYSNSADGVKVGEANQSASKATITSSLITGNGGYGLWLITGSSATLSYTGLSSNSLGNIKGSPSQTSNNTQSAGYLSTSPSASSFLKIATTSYQYKAGPKGTPVGARY